MPPKKSRFEFLPLFLSEIAVNAETIKMCRFVVRLALHLGVTDELVLRDAILVGLPRGAAWVKTVRLIVERDCMFCIQMPWLRPATPFQVPSLLNILNSAMKIWFAVGAVQL